MSTLEATVSMIELLTEDNLLLVRDFTKNILDSQSLGTMSREQFLQELEISRKQADNGEYSSARDTLQKMRAKYGIYGFC